MQTTIRQQICLILHTYFTMSDVPTPSQVAMLAALAVAKITANHASPMKSQSTLALDNFDEAKRRQALSSDAI
jgi:hypothetical protein